MKIPQHVLPQGQDSQASARVKFWRVTGDVRRFIGGSVDGWRDLRVKAVVCLSLGLLVGSGCRQFGASRLDCELPEEFEYVEVNEPSLRPIRFSGMEIPPPPMDLNADLPDVERRYLTITDAMAIALQKNPAIYVDRYQQQEVARNIVLADSVYDPLLQLGGGWSKTESQITNVINGPGIGVSGSSTDAFGPPEGMSDLIRLSKKTRTGGNVSTQLGATYSFVTPDGNFLTQNPAVRSTVGFQASHPLFRGSGREVNALTIRVARMNSHGSIHRTRVTINKTLVDVATAYWALYGAIAELTSQESGVAEADETLKEEREKLELGASSRTQIAEATEQFERFRANRALARKAVADAERSLRSELGIEQEDGTRLIPTTIPESSEMFFDWEAGYRSAMESRPELRIQEANMKAAQLEVSAARDLCRPNINAYAGYSVSGAGGTIDQSLDVLESNDYTSWWMGFSYRQQLGRRVERATQCKAEFKLAREIASMQQVKQTVLGDLHEAYQAVTNAWTVMELQKERRHAAAEILKARRAMYEVGEISLELYLRGLSGFSISASEERSSIARYNQAIVRWEYAQGRLLEYSGIQFAVFDPDNPDATPNSEFINQYLEPPPQNRHVEPELIDLPELGDGLLSKPLVPAEDDVSLNVPVKSWDEMFLPNVSTGVTKVAHTEAVGGGESGTGDSANFATLAGSGVDWASDHRAPIKQSKIYGSRTSWPTQ